MKCLGSQAWLRQGQLYYMPLSSEHFPDLWTFNNVFDASILLHSFFIPPRLRSSASSQQLTKFLPNIEVSIRG
jgi:hypothetical protein